MLTGISTGAANTIKSFTASNAFKNVQEVLNEKNQDRTSSGVELNDNNFLLKNQNLSEIRNYAKIVGEDNLSDEDIKYGLTYGRSVIAEYVI